MPAASDPTGAALKGQSCRHHRANDAEREDFWIAPCWGCACEVVVNMYGMGNCSCCGARLPLGTEVDRPLAREEAVEGHLRDMREPRPEIFGMIEAHVREDCPETAIALLMARDTVTPRLALELADAFGLGSDELVTATFAERPRDYLEDPPPEVEVAAGTTHGPAGPSRPGDRWLAIVPRTKQLVEVVAVDRSTMALAAENGMGC